MPQPIIHILTLNWNRAQETLECVRSLLEQDYPHTHLVVVDNASTDGSPELLATQFPQVEQLRNEVNLGFAAGFNRGLIQALQQRAEWIFIVNNDTYLHQACLSRLIHFSSPETGILAPMVYYANPPDRIWSAGGKISPWTLEQSHDWAGSSHPDPWPDTIERDFVSGCAMLIRAQALAQVGLFDEGYKMYYEDYDLCRRFRQAGYRILLVPQASLWHKVATSSGGPDAPNERYWMARSSVRFFRKHGHGWQYPLIGFWRTASAIRTTLRLIRAGKWAATRAYWRGIRDGLGEIMQR